MKLINITLKSLGRQKRKKAFLLLAMILSFTTILTLYTFTESQTRKIENQFDEFGANIIITPKTDELSLNYGGISFKEVVSIKELNKEDLKEIEDIPEFYSIRAISPKLIGAVNVTTSKKEERVVVVGTDFENVYKIKGWWDDDQNTPKNYEDLIIGWDVAEKLGITLGDEILLKEKPFKAARILPPGGNEDDNVIIASLEAVEDLLNKKGKITMVEVSALCSLCPIENLVRQISETLPNANVRALKEVMVQRMEVVNQIERFAFTISVILVLICTLLIFSNITASITERRHEIGIYRAIGFTKRHIIQIIQGESAILSFVSGILGIVLTLGVVYTFLPSFAGIPREEILFNPLFFLKSFLFLMVLGFAASLMPAVSASNTDPVKTINSF